MKTHLYLKRTILSSCLLASIAFAVGVASAQKPADRRSSSVRLVQSDYAFEAFRLLNSDRTPILMTGGRYVVPYDGTEKQLIMDFQVRWNRKSGSPAARTSAKIVHPVVECWALYPGETRRVMCGRLSISMTESGLARTNYRLRIPAGLSNGARIEVNAILARIQSGTDSNSGNNEQNVTAEMRLR